MNAQPLSDQCLRIVAWNCRDKFDQKAQSFLGLKPDIGIVPESCSSPSICQQTLFESPVPHAWTGHSEHKGLGIFAPGAVRLEQVGGKGEWIGEHGIAGVAVRPAGEVGVLGVWTVPAQGKGDPYLAAARGIVERYAHFLDSGNVVMAGDFNASGRTAFKEMEGFMRELQKRFGLVSAVHKHHSFPLGQEPYGTLWWRGSEHDSFHCDFVFIPQAWTIRHVEVGSYHQWGSVNAVARSDHAPIIVDVTYPPSSFEGCGA